MSATNRMVIGRGIPNGGSRAPGVVSNTDTELRAVWSEYSAAVSPTYFGIEWHHDITQVRHGETPAWLLSIDVAAALAQYL